MLRVRVLKSDASDWVAQDIRAVGWDPRVLPGESGDKAAIPGIQIRTPIRYPSVAGFTNARSRFGARPDRTARPARPALHSAGDIVHAQLRRVRFFQSGPHVFEKPYRLHALLEIEVKLGKSFLHHGIGPLEQLQTLLRQ